MTGRWRERLVSQPDIASVYACTLGLLANVFDIATEPLELAGLCAPNEGWT
jgi:hypothetical protein